MLMHNEKNTKITNEINDGENDINTNNFTNQTNEKLADKSKQKNDKSLINRSDKESKFQD
jgi:hypothetical protein